MNIFVSTTLIAQIQAFIKAPISENPDEIMGKQITVQYFEETTNKNGTHSLRFPVIKAVYENVRTF